MKALSLWQPWASFIAIGVKPFETRGWSPPVGLIGQRIAIHAAKKAVDADNREWAQRVGVSGDLPLGAVVCTAVLRGAYQCGRENAAGCRIARTVIGSPDHTTLNIDDFGDYAEGHWAWHLTDIERFEPPIPARGAQGLWDWHG